MVGEIKDVVARMARGEVSVEEGLVGIAEQFSVAGAPSHGAPPTGAAVADDVAG